MNFTLFCLKYIYDFPALTRGQKSLQIYISVFRKMNSRKYQKTG